MNLDWTNLVSVDSIQPGHSQLKLDWVSSEALVRMEQGEHLPNTEPLLIALPILILENKMNLDWTNLVSANSIQPRHSQSNVGLGVQ